MGFIDRIKSSYFYTNLKVGRYTKRRRALVSEFNQKPAEFYERYYRDGEYLHQEVQRKRMSYDVQLHNASGRFQRQRSADSSNNGNTLSNGTSWRFGDDDDGEDAGSFGLPPTPTSWETISDRNPPRLAIESGDATDKSSVERSGYYRGSMYGAPNEFRNSMIEYNSSSFVSTEQQQQQPHASEMAIQSKLDAEYMRKQDMTDKSYGHNRHRMTFTANEIRCSEMYNMSWL
ncbi:hypothetical protein BDF22DRAFT_653844 [Syncephalis plumigaleata]|nr:hypothetical protein BDF22DRAFT_653844 [Syncephalis plumigaleata]